MHTEFCRVCLNIDVKLYMMRDSLLEAYKQITGFTSTTESLFLVCLECGVRLLNHMKFERKCLHSHTILTGILKACGEYVIENLRSIDRLTENLISNLQWKRYEPNHYDFYYQATEETNSFNEHPPSLLQVNLEIDEIKDETEDFDTKSIDGSVKSDPISDSIDKDIPLAKKVKRKKVRKKKKPKRIVKGAKADKRKKSVGEDLDEKIFVSSSLDLKEQISEFQKRKESANYKNAVFKCTDCFKGFLDEAAYKNHMIRHTNQCGLFVCDVCKVHFKRAPALRNHVTSHAHRHACRRSTYVTYRKQTAKLHEEWHNGTKYRCPHCTEEFLKFTTYMGHVRIKHPTDHVCPICGYSFVSEKGLRLHKRLKHRLDDLEVAPEDGPYCATCDVTFVTDDAHRRHLQVSGRHTETADNESNGNSSKKPRGNKVKRITKEVNELKKIKKRPIIKPEGPIACEQCGVQLDDCRAYYKHFRRAHPDKNRTNYPSMKSPCMCEICGRMFQTLALLLDHRWVHTTEKRFTCELCNKTFQQKQRLVAHRHIHSKQRASYVCSVCGKTFTTHSNRQRHMFSHTGLKPFKCEMCGKGFKHASEKRAHVTYVHLKKPWPKRARSKRARDVGTQGRDDKSSDMNMTEPLWPPAASCAAPEVPDHHDKPHTYYLPKM